jgi:hypothetical protein
VDEDVGRLIEIEKFEIRMFVIVSCSCGSVVRDPFVPF